MVGFNKKIKDMQKIARDLGYDKDIINKLAKAENEIQLENIMIAARHSK